MTKEDEEKGLAFVDVLPWKLEDMTSNKISGMRCWKDGFECGYNKANEWRYPSKGEYPNDFEDVLICFLTEDDAKDCVRGWYEYDFENDKHIFKYLNVLEIQCLKTVIAWKKLVLPELPKERE